MAKVLCIMSTAGNSVAFFFFFTSALTLISVLSIYLTDVSHTPPLHSATENRELEEDDTQFFHYFIPIQSLQWPPMKKLLQLAGRSRHWLVTFLSNCFCLIAWGEKVRDERIISVLWLIFNSAIALDRSVAVENFWNRKMEEWRIFIQSCYTFPRFLICFNRTFDHFKSFRVSHVV